MADSRAAAHRRRPAIDEPFGWWGPVWSAPAPRSLASLVDDDILSLDAAALLAAAVNRHASIVVAAGPSGAGKTTLLTALLDFLPETARRCYLRGCYEPFDFLDQSDPATAVLLVNEISPHLPIYLWGPGVRRALDAAQTGFQLLGTAHATTVNDFVYSLAGYPLRIPIASLGVIDLLVLLEAWLDGRAVRRQVRQIVRLASSSDAGGLTPEIIANRPTRAQPLTINRDTVAGVWTQLGSSPAELAPDLARFAALLSPRVEGPSDDRATPVSLVREQGWG